MTVTRHEPSTMLSKAVEANGFAFTAGVVADDLNEDVKGQSHQILAEIDRLLKLSGTDKTKVVSATIWVADINPSRERAARSALISGRSSGGLVDRAYRGNGFVKEAAFSTMTLLRTSPSSNRCPGSMSYTLISSLSRFWTLMFSPAWVAYCGPSSSKKPIRSPG